MNYKLLMAIASTMLVCDFIWLGFVSRDFYVVEFGQHMKQPIDYLAAIGAYVLMILGVYVFVFHNSLADSRLLITLLGAFLGLVLYGVYDFTNMATLTHWSKKVVLVDVSWGVVLCAVTSFVASFFR